MILSEITIVKITGGKKLAKYRKAILAKEKSTTGRNVVIQTQLNLGLMTGYFLNPLLPGLLSRLNMYRAVIATHQPFAQNHLLLHP